MNPLPAVTAASPNPHFERLGGTAAVQRLVDAFYEAMDTRADAQAIRAMHAADLTPTKAVLVAYLTEWLGGPRLYSPTRGTPKLRRVHLHYPIDRAASQAWMACMQQALDRIGADTALCDELRSAFAKIAAHIENTH